MKFNISKLWIIYNFKTWKWKRSIAIDREYIGNIKDNPQKSESW